jgi:acetylornithine deacetylase/succinyl-diaminopimelate desuccinylase-like protein
MEQSILAWCRRLIGCRSVTGEGTRAIAELCAAELLAPRGISARLIPSSREGAEQVNLIAIVKGRDSALTPLVLNTHLDTVPPGDLALWTECASDPFTAQLSGERIYGLGAADTKLDLLAKTVALGECRVPRRDVYLVGTFGEEHGLVGAKEIAEAGLVPRGAIAFVGEPSHLEVITAHKGLMVFELKLEFEPLRIDGAESTARAIFTGRAAHSSTPHLGQNAIVAALKALAAHSESHVVSLNGGDAVNKVPARCEAIVVAGDTWPIANAAIEPSGEKMHEFIPQPVIAMLARFVDALSGFADRTGAPEPGYTAPTLTCNPGVIRSSSNSVDLEFELRPPPALALDVVRDGVAKIVDELARNTQGIRAKVSEKRANPGFRSESGSTTVELAMAAMARASLPPKTGVKTGCTEAGIYAAAGLTPVVIGPGPSTGVIHAPNEYNLLSDVDAAIRFYRELLQL